MTDTLNPPLDTPRISWAAVWAGVFAALAVQILLIMLGIGSDLHRPAVGPQHLRPALGSLRLVGIRGRHRCLCRWLARGRARRLSHGSHDVGGQRRTARIPGLGGGDGDCCRRRRDGGRHHGHCGRQPRGPDHRDARRLAAGGDRYRGHSPARDDRRSCGERDDRPIRPTNCVPRRTRSATPCWAASSRCFSARRRLAQRTNGPRNASAEPDYLTCLLTSPWSLDRSTSCSGEIDWQKLCRWSPDVKCRASLGNPQPT